MARRGYFRPSRGRTPNFQRVCEPTGYTSAVSGDATVGSDELGLGPLTPDEVSLIVQASQRGRAATRAALLATIHGVSFAVCAAACVPLALLDPWLLAVGLVLGAVAAVELRGGRMVRAFEVSGARLLALNQLALLVLVLIYCAYRLWAGLTGPSLREQLLVEVPDLATLLASTTELSGIDPMLDHIDHIYHLSVIALYGGVIVVSVLYQGLCAFYYWTRGAALSAYLRETPGWVRELLRRTEG